MNKGEAADWIAQLHNKDAVELHDADEFIQLLQGRFKDTDQKNENQAIIKGLKQETPNPPPPQEFIWEFQRVAGNLARVYLSPLL